MKPLFTVMIALCTVVLATAQKKANLATTKYKNYQYLEASKHYKRLVRRGDDSMETLTHLGDTHYYNSDMEGAVEWYGQLFSKYERSLSPKQLFRYIHALKGVGSYDLAKTLMKVYGEKLGSKGFEVAQFQDNDKPLEVLRQQRPKFIISNLSINTPLADFGPMFYQDKIVFASSRDSANLHTRVYQWNKQPYLNLYMADTLNLGADLVTVEKFGNSINTRYHEAATAFNKEGTLLYFTRNNYSKGVLERDGEGTNHLKLYRSKLLGGLWADPQEVPFNSTNYSVGQPALSADGKKLYFVSDMPGGYGETDIYFVNIDAQGNYSEPINAGATINTSAREMFPYLTKEKLYFASDGHLGLGGLDVFEISLEGDLDLPKNLGPGLNSRKDDFAYIVSEKTHRGYFSSNRDGGSGDDDIYAFQRFPEKCLQTVKGVVLRKANELPVSNAKVDLVDSDGSIMGTTATDSSGVFNFENALACGHNFEIKVTKEGYEAVGEHFITGHAPDLVNEVPITMTKALNKLIVNENGVLKIKIDNIYFDLNKADIRPDAAQELDRIVEVMKEYPKMIIKIEAHTDSRGSDSYNEKLSGQRAKSAGNYIVSQGIAANRIESAIGYGEKQLLNKCSNGVKCANKEHDANRRSEFIIVGLE